VSAPRKGLAMNKATLSEISFRGPSQNIAGSKNRANRLVLNPSKSISVRRSNIKEPTPVSRLAALSPIQPPGRAGGFKANDFSRVRFSVPGFSICGRM